MILATVLEAGRYAYPTSQMEKVSLLKGTLFAQGLTNQQVTGRIKPWTLSPARKLAGYEVLMSKD